MSTLYGDVRAILAHHRAIEAHVSRGGIACIRGTFAQYDAASWAEFKARELDRRINEKSICLGQAPARQWRKLEDDYQRDLARDAWAVRDRLEKRVRVRRFLTDVVRARLGHLQVQPEDE